jgi:cysteine desulfurase
MSVSAHKAYGPKGAGALLVSQRRGTHLTPILYGGGQEGSLRSGTVATHQAVGMGAAFELASAAPAAEYERIAALAEDLWQRLRELGGVLRNGDRAARVPHVLNVSFEGVEGESLLAAVQPYLAVSTGSACMSATQEPSYVLRALGRDDRLAESSLRFSFGRFTSETDIDTAGTVVTRAVERLRRIAGT